MNGSAVSDAHEEHHVDAQAPDGAHRLWRLRPTGQRVFAWPGLRLLRPLARRAFAVAEPAGRLRLKPQPARPPPAAADHLTFLSTNLWHDWPRGRRWPERLEAVATLAEAESADVILLQEVARTQALPADTWLARRLGMACAYSRANGHADAIGFEEGLAVLSRFPLAAPRLQQLGPGTNPFVRRLALAIEVATPVGDLLAVSVHLALRRGHNALQLAQLRTWVAQAAGERPAVIGGDYNAPEHRAEIRSTQRAWLDTFRHLHPEADGTTHEIFWPWGRLLRRHRLDYIFFQAGRGAGQWRVLETRHLDAPGGPHSDHRAVLTRLAPGS